MIVCTRNFSVWMLLGSICCLFGSRSCVDAAHSRRRTTTTTTRRIADSYDRSVTTFDPTGRLLQVEYANQASQKAPSVVALWLPAACGDSIFVVTPSDRAVHRLSDTLFLVTAGLAGDSEYLAKEMRTACQNFALSNGVEITATQAATVVSEFQHELSVTAGARSLGVTCMVVGVEEAEHTGRSSLRILRCTPGTPFEDCGYCAAGVGHEKIQAHLGEKYVEWRKQKEVDPSAVFEGLVSSIQKSLKGKKNDLNVWVFHGRNDGLKIIHYNGIDSAESLDRAKSHMQQSKSI